MTEPLSTAISLTMYIDPFYFVFSHPVCSLSFIAEILDLATARLIMPPDTSQSISLTWDVNLSIDIRLRSVNSRDNKRHYIFFLRRWFSRLIFDLAVYIWNKVAGSTLVGVGNNMSSSSQIDSNILTDVYVIHVYSGIKREKWRAI